MKGGRCNLLSFYIGIAVLFLFLIVLFKKAGVSSPFSRIALLSTLFSILAAVCLAQNYTESLIPAMQDGISISNTLAYYLIGEDGWSHATFRAAFHYAVVSSILCLMLYIAASIQESRKKG